MCLEIYSSINVSVDAANANTHTPLGLSCVLTFDTYAAINKCLSIALFAKSMLRRCQDGNFHYFANFLPFLTLHETYLFERKIYE